MTYRTVSSPFTQPRPVPAEAAMWAVVPVKVLSEAKQRLHSCLGAKRRGFTLAMLDDVLNALADSRVVDQVACVTADPRVAALARGQGVLIVDEGHCQGMNKAISLGIDTARRYGSRRVVVLPADLPLASGSEIDRLLLTMNGEAKPGQSGVIGMSPAADGQGTNFLCLETAEPFEMRFGPNSFEKHRACARTGGFRAKLLHSEALSFDIDCEQDLQDLISYCCRHPEYQRTRSWKFLRRHGMAVAAEQSG